MADVTISNLTKGTPTGNAILPYSAGSNTLAVATSAIFENVSTGIGINCKPESSETKLFIRSSYPNSYLFGLSGSGKSSAMYLLVDVDNKRQTCLTDSNGARTLVFDNSVVGQTNTQFWNNNTEAIRINSSNNVGIGTSTPATKLDVNGVIKSQQIAFCATNLDGPYFYFPSIITYNTVTVNRGNGLNASTGKFTAPVAGCYYFEFTGIKASGGYDPTQVNFFLNDVNTRYRSYSPGTGHTPIAMSAIFNLNANDVVYVKLHDYSTGAINSNEATQFVGYLIG